MSTTEEEVIVRRFLALWSERDADAMAALIAEDGIYDNVPQNKPLLGREATRKWLQMCFEHLTRIDVEVLNIATNGEWVLSERVDTHVSDDRLMPLQVMGACRIVDGKIQMWRDYYDVQTVVALGMV
jgi:limonene-1,2-epoxide hydrolase